MTMKSFSRFRSRLVWRAGKVPCHALNAAWKFSLPAVVGAALLAVINASGGDVHYTYDAAGRLVSADYGTAGSLAYSYDAAGNLLTRTVQTGGSDRPALSVELLTPTQIVLSWSTNYAGFTLQSADSLAGGHSWVDFTGQPARAGGKFVITNAIAPVNSTFFRLKGQ